MRFKDYLEVIDFSPLYKTLKDRRVYHTELAEYTGKDRQNIQAMFRNERLSDTKFIFDTAKMLKCHISDIVSFTDIKPRYPLLSLPPKENSILSYSVFLANIEYAKGKPASELLADVDDMDLSEDLMKGFYPEGKVMTNRKLSPMIIRKIIHNEPVHVTVIYNICKHFKCYPDDVLSVV